MVIIVTVFHTSFNWTFFTHPWVIAFIRVSSWLWSVLPYFNNALSAIPLALITIRITVTFIFHNFFEFSGKSQIFFFLLFSTCGPMER